MRYTPDETSRECHLMSTTGERVTLQNLPTEKGILILHQDLECSGCLNAIYQLLNQTKAEKLHIGHVYTHPLNGFSAYEISSRISQHLNQPFALYSSASPNFSDITTPRHIPENEFPCLLLFDNNGIRKLFSASEMFTPSLTTTAFNSEFLNEWQLFFSSP